MKHSLLALCFFASFSLFSAPLLQNAAEPDTSKLLTTHLPVISAHAKRISPHLPAQVDENSGLILWRGKLWTHNDSGGEAEIYAIDTSTGQVVQTIKLPEAENQDWEDISQDQDFIYPADVGNNRGSRKQLVIYKVAKNKIPPTADVQVSEIETIRFSYSDQVSFDKRMNNHNFDCEAIASWGDSIYLFTKNWENQRTKMYAIPKIAGDYKLSTLADFDAGGLITAAEFSPDGSQLALLGYADYVSFMWLFWDYEGNDFFGAKKLRIDFPDLVFVQTEGLCFTTEQDIVFSCEESAEPPMRFRVNTDSLKSIAISQLGNYAYNKIQLSGIPPTTSESIHLDILELPEAEFRFELRDRRWKKLIEGKGKKKRLQRKAKLKINTTSLENGLYFLKISSGEHSIIKKIKIAH